MLKLFLLAAVFCIAGVTVAVWMTISLRQVVKCRWDVARADKYFYMDHIQYANARKAEADISVQMHLKECLETSEETYQNVANAYNLCLKKPQNRIAVWVLGYKPTVSGMGLL